MQRPAVELDVRPSGMSQQFADELRKRHEFQSATRRRVFTCHVIRFGASASCLIRSLTLFLMCDA